jgi:hypothetical protein
VRRSRRRGLREKLLLPLVGVLPYRCQECDKRFLDLSASHDDVSHTQPPRQPHESTLSESNESRRKSITA